MLKTISRSLVKKNNADIFRSGVAFTALFFLSLCLMASVNAQETKQATNLNTNVAAKNESQTSQKIVQEGIAIEFSVTPITGNAVMEGEDALVQFKVSDTSTDTPITGLNLSAWMKQREAGKSADAGQCKEMVKSFLQGSLRARSDVDLNSYYILALNDEPNISVIDPLLGFGGSKLMTLVMLKSPGAAWVMTGDQRHLFVTMPLINEVAVVDTATWKVISNIAVGAGATQLALQPDEKYLWVADDGPDSRTGGVTAIDTATLKSAGRIITGGTSHKLAVSPDNRFVLAGNKSNGAVSVIDVAKMVKVKDIETGSDTAVLQFSPLSKAFYAVSEKDGLITVIDAAGRRTVATMTIKPGLGALRFAPGGRYGFVVNPKENAVTIFDASTNRLVQTVVVGKTPDQVVFSDTFAYVRSTNSEEVNLIRLSTIGKELDVTMFPGGQLAPGNLSAGDTIVPAPDGAAMLVANPADKIIYYYSEGMAAPMGNFQNYRRTPRSIKIADRSLRETKPGFYATTVRLPKNGEYDVAFLADSPRVTHCFDAKAVVNPAKKRQQQNVLRIEHLIKDRTIEVNKSLLLRFKLLDAATNKPKENLKDVRVLTFLAPGIWQKRDFARSIGNGVYEVELNVPQSGVYMVFVEVASQGLSYRQLASLTLHAAEQPASTAVDEVTKSLVP
ncbi:MAG: YncE family protein [Pyrinomonadaceae bacterium]